MKAPRPRRSLRAAVIGALAVVVLALVVFAATGVWRGTSNRLVPIAGSPGLVLEGSETDLAALSVTEQKRQLAEMHSDGARWIKLTVNWAGHEPVAGKFDWYLTPIIKEVRAAGMNVEALLSNPPGWAGPSDGRAPSVPAFTSFVAAAVATYGALGVTDFEVWNEENTTQPWGQALSPQQFTTLLCAADGAIRSVNPHAEVIAGGFAPAPDNGNLSYEPYTYLEGMYQYGAKGCFDAVADHAYSYPDLPDNTADAWNPFAYLPTLHSIMVAHGDGAKLIWLTEVGAPVGGVQGAVSLDGQAQTISQDFAFARRTPWIGPVIVADWRDSIYDEPRLPFGLLDQDGHPRPALGAFERAAQTYADPDP